MQLGSIFVSVSVPLSHSDILLVETRACLLGMVLVFTGRGMVVSFEASITIKI